MRIDGTHFVSRPRVPGPKPVDRPPKPAELPSPRADPPPALPVTGPRDVATVAAPNPLASVSRGPIAVERLRRERVEVPTTEASASDLEAMLQILAGREREELQRTAVDVAERGLRLSAGKIAAEADRYGITASTTWTPERPFVVTYSMPNDPETRGLAAAAGALADILTRQRDEVAQIHASHRDTYQHLPDGAARFVDQAGHDEMARRVATAERAARSEFAPILAEYPVLSAFARPISISELQTIAGGPGPATARVVTDAIRWRKQSIREMNRRLENDPAIVWRLPRLVETAKAAMNVEPGSSSDLWITEQQRSVERDKTLVDLFFAATSIGVGVLAAVPTGGASVTAAAAIGGVVNGVQFYRDLDEYSLMAAAAHTDLDAARSLSGEAPSPAWLVLDAVGVGADAVGVARGLPAVLEAKGFVTRGLTPGTRYAGADWATLRATRTRQLGTPAPLDRALIQTLAIPRGGGTNWRYGKLAARAVRHLEGEFDGERITTFRASLDWLGVRVNDIAQEMSRTDGPSFAIFGKPRYVAMTTALDGQYEDYAVAARALPEIIARRAQYEDGMELSAFVKFGNNLFVDHTDPRWLDRIIDGAEPAFQRALHASDRRSLIRAVAELHWIGAAAMPFERASAGAMDILTKALLRRGGIRPGPWRKGVAVDLEAVELHKEAFVRRYPTFFDVVLDETKGATP